MQNIILRVTVVCMALGLTAYYVFGQPSVGERALSAYKAGDYQGALPLFKKWAGTPEIRGDAEKRKVVMSYIIATQQRLLPAATAAAPVAATGTGDPAVDQSNLMQQALSFAMAQRKNPSDPAPGADRVPHLPPTPGETRDLAIKALGNFEFDPNKDTQVPADVAALDGAHLRLTGFMIPLTQAEKLSDFALVPSLVSCCFGQPPGVQHIITCRTPPKKGVDFAVDELVVEGVLHVNVRREDNYTNSIFEMEVSSVKLKE